MVRFLCLRTVDLRSKKAKVKDPMFTAGIWRSQWVRNKQSLMSTSYICCLKIEDPWLDRSSSDSKLRQLLIVSASPSPLDRFFIHAFIMATWSKHQEKRVFSVAI